MKQKNMLVALKPMTKIVQSPHEGSGMSIRSGESDERIFDKLKALLEPVVTGRSKNVSPEAIKFFGRLYRLI